jgi:hypothetical protein
MLNRPLFNKQEIYNYLKNDPYLILETLFNYFIGYKKIKAYLR